MIQPLHSTSKMITTMAGIVSFFAMRCGRTGISAEVTGRTGTVSLTTGEWRNRLSKSLSAEHAGPLQALRHSDTDPPAFSRVLSAESVRVPPECPCETD